MQTVGLLVRRSLDVVLPVSCAGCGAAGPVLCERCSAALSGAVPRMRSVGGLPVWSALDYGGAVRRILLACKNGGRTDVAAPLGRALRDAVGTALDAYRQADQVVLVRMARTPRSTRERGFEPVAVLLERARLPSARWLRLTTAPADQAGLGRAERLSNVAGRMRADPRCAGRAVLVVDDVVTTGATFVESFRALSEAGAEVLGGVAVAGVPRIAR